MGLNIMNTKAIFRKTTLVLLALSTLGTSGSVLAIDIPLKGAVKSNEEALILIFKLREMRRREEKTRADKHEYQIEDQRLDRENKILEETIRKLQREYIKRMRQQRILLKEQRAGRKKSGAIAKININLMATAPERLKVIGAIIAKITTNRV